MSVQSPAKGGEVLRRAGRLALRNKLIIAITVVFGVVALVISLAGTRSQGSSAQPDPVAPGFTLTALGDPSQHITLSQYQGKPLIVNFWASWCQPCVEEAPSLNQLQRRIAPLGGTILGVNVGVDDGEDTYEKFLSDYHIDFPTYRDSTEKLAASYGTTAYPETYVIDRQGRLDRKIVGPQDWTSPEMMAYLDSLLNEN